MTTHATTTISGDLIADVRASFELSLDYVLKRKGVRHGINGYTPRAFSAYVASVASIEAFLNEAFLGTMPQVIFPDSPLWTFREDTLDRLDIREKLMIIPKLLFDVSFERDAQPYQDFNLLVKARNDIVHFKMQVRSPNYLADLSQRGIALTAENKVNADYSWPSKLSCTEGIRWAHNTACKIIHRLVGFVPEGKPLFARHMAGNFVEIPDQYVQGWFKEHGFVQD